MLTKFLTAISSPVCMHACMYACMHVCMCVCVCVCMYVCMYVCVYVCIYIHTCIHICTFIYTTYICAARLVHVLLEQVSGHGDVCNDAQCVLDVGRVLERLACGESRRWRVRASAARVRAHQQQQERGTLLAPARRRRRRGRRGAFGTRQTGKLDGFEMLYKRLDEGASVVQPVPHLRPPRPAERQPQSRHISGRTVAVAAWRGRGTTGAPRCRGEVAQRPRRAQNGPSTNSHTRTAGRPLTSSLFSAKAAPPRPPATR